MPRLSALAPGVTHLPGFGRYGGVNDRFAIVCGRGAGHHPVWQLAGRRAVFFAVCAAA